MGSSSAPALPAEVAGVISAWVPHSVRDEPSAVLAAATPIVRHLVAAAEPTTPTAAAETAVGVGPDGVLGASDARSVQRP